jgi:outer membrane protein OmpU
MRKYLLSTSALAGAALLSTAAIAADVSINGSFEWDYAARDSNVAANDGNLMGHDQEAHINFTTKTSDGYTITATNQLKTSSNADNSDDTSVSISGGFGTLTLGQTDGASDKYGMNALGLTAEEETGTLNSGAGTTASISTSTAGADGNGNKLTYHIPPVGGLTAGVSVATNTISGDDDTTAVGFNYALTAGGAAVKIGYSSSSTETAGGTDVDGTSMGVNIVMNGISVTASNGSHEADDEDRSTNAAGISYTLANGLKLGYSTVKSEDDLDVGEEYTANHYEAQYAIIEGLTAVLNVSDFDYEVTAGNHENTPVDQNGTITSLTLKASF